MSAELPASVGGFTVEGGRRSRDVHCSVAGGRFYGFAMDNGDRWITVRMSLDRMDLLVVAELVVLWAEDQDPEVVELPGDTRVYTRESTPLHLFSVEWRGRDIRFSNLQVSCSHPGSARARIWFDARPRADKLEAVALLAAVKAFPLDQGGEVAP